MAVGVLLIALGVFACYWFFAATLATVYTLGGILIVGGLFYGASAFSARKWSIALLDVLACALYVIAGIVAFRQPIATAGAVTLVLSALYIVQGISRIVGALTLKTPGWGWMLFNGIVTLLFGAVIFAQWPAGSLWLIGVLVGIDLMLAGWTMLFGGMAVNRLQPART
jgi:uncharacterized membrane protein HdeD (DUF308 family)